MGGHEEDANGAEMRQSRSHTDRQMNKGGGGSGLSCHSLIVDVMSLPVLCSSVTDPGDAIIRVTSTTVCGSDLHMYYNAITDSPLMEVR